MPEFTTKQREKLAEEDEAMPDGSYPIRNRADLKRAIQAFGRSKNPEKTKAWIKKRARELDAEDLIPESWLEHFDDDSEYLIHYGVMGMKWGVRRASKNPADSKRGRRKLAKELNKDAESRYKKLATAGKLTKGQQKALSRGLDDYRKNLEYNLRGKSAEEKKAGKKQIKSFLDEVAVDYKDNLHRDRAKKQAVNSFVKKYGKDSYDKVLAQVEKDKQSAKKRKVALNQAKAGAFAGLAGWALLQTMKR